MRRGSIYTLSDPSSGLVRYIGQTIVNPNNRYAQHIYQWKRSLGKITHLNSWIKSLSIDTLKPILDIIETDINIEELDNKEINYIKLFKSVGAKLCNHTQGGNGTRGFKHSQDSKNKRLLSLKTSQAWKDKHIRHSNIMKEAYKEGKLKIGRKYFTEEQKLKIDKSLSLKAIEFNKNNPKRLDAIRQSIRRKVVSLKTDLTIDKVFDSISSAADYYDIFPTSITRVCRGKSHSTSGVIFRYLGNNNTIIAIYPEIIKMCTRTKTEKARKEKERKVKQNKKK